MPNLQVMHRNLTHERGKKCFILPTLYFHHRTTPSGLPQLFSSTTHLIGHHYPLPEMLQTPSTATTSFNLLKRFEHDC